MDYRVLTEAERKYTFSQSQQLSMGKMSTTFFVNAWE